jgi:hypothetical protein
MSSLLAHATSNFNDTYVQNDASDGAFLEYHSAPSGSGPSFGDAGLVTPSLFNDKIFSYQGPWESHGLSTDWLHHSINTDLSKYGLDTADVTF